jgi:type IV pilus assembly protein PilW
MSPASESSTMPIFAKQQRGLSLVELMVSIVIGLVLVTGIIQVFLSSQQTYTAQQEIARLQENIRFSHEFLNRDIRMAGYAGCISIGNTQYENLLKNTTAKFDLNFDNAVWGIDNNIAGAKVDTDISPNENTDVLVLRTPVGDAVDVTVDTNGTQLIIKDTSNIPSECPATGKSGFCPDDFLLISNCVSKSFIFQAASLTPNTPTVGSVKIVHNGATDPGNNLTTWGGDNGLGTNLGVGSQVIKYQTTVYYIGTSINADGTLGEPALFSRTGKDGTGNQLVEGVEDMQIEYGIDTSAASGRTFEAAVYKSANNVTATEWPNVVSVRIKLLVRSKANLLETASDDKEIINGVAIAADKRLRQLADFTVGIRSRLK